MELTFTRQSQASMMGKFFFIMICPTQAPKTGTLPLQIQHITESSPWFSQYGGIKMAKKSTESLARVMRAKRSVKSISDKKIDFSDIPEITDAQQKKGIRPGRPLLGSAARTMIAIRIDPSVLKKLKIYADKRGKGYQTLINEILGKFIKNQAA